MTVLQLPGGCSGPSARTARLPRQEDADLIVIHDEASVLVVSDYPAGAVEPSLGLSGDRSGSQRLKVGWLGERYVLERQAQGPEGDSVPTFVICSPFAGVAADACHGPEAQQLAWPS